MGQGVDEGKTWEGWSHFLQMFGGLSLSVGFFPRPGCWTGQPPAELGPCLPLKGPPLWSWGRFPLWRGIYLCAGMLYPSSVHSLVAVCIGSRIELLKLETGLHFWSVRLLKGDLGIFYAASFSLLVFFIGWWVWGVGYQEMCRSPVVCVPNIVGIHGVPLLGAVMDCSWDGWPNEGTKPFLT